MQKLGVHVKLAAVLIICAMGLTACHNHSNRDETAQELLAITANANDNTATIFDSSSLDVLYNAVALSGEWPWEIALSSDGETAYVMNRDSNNISIVGLSAGTEIGTIDLTGDQPAKAVIAADGFLYVCYLASDFVSKVDIAAATPAETAQIALSAGISWTAIAATPAGDYLYVGGLNTNALAKIDVATGTEVGSWTEVDGIPINIWDIEINGDGLAFFATYDTGQITTWDTVTDTPGTPLESGQPAEWMVDMVLDGSNLLGTFYGDYIEYGNDNGGIVVIDTGANFENYAYSQADDDSYDVELPFTFTFLGSDYTTVSVNSNGVVSFDGYVDYDSDMDGVTGFSPNNEDLDSSYSIFNYSSMLHDDHAVFQWSTSMNDDEPNPNYVSVFEVVLFADGKARFDYAFSMPEAIKEDDGYLYGVGDGSTTPIVDLRATLGSPFDLQRRSFLWDPAVSTTSMTEVPFQWEGTGVLHLPVTGLPHGVAVGEDYIFVPLDRDYATGSTSNTVFVYDRATGLPVAPLTVGAGPRAIAIQPAPTQ